MRDRKILLLFIATIIFGLIVVFWYFSKATVESNPSIATPTNPFGAAQTKPGSEFIGGQTTPYTSTDTENERIPASERMLVQIWDKPVGGYAFASREIIVEATSTATSTASSTPKKLPKPIKKTIEYILFVDRLTGYIYGYNKQSVTPFQITNTTLPGIHDAYITQNGTKVFMRYFDENEQTIKTLTAIIPSFIEGASPRALSDIRYLQDDITSFATSASGDSYSYLVPSANGSTAYTINAKGVSTISSSPLREWTIVYGGETPYTYNKPSA